MRIAIFGTGGIGGYFGGRLAQAGEDVVFIARGEHLQAMRTKLRLPRVCPGADGVNFGKGVHVRPGGDHDNP